MLYPAHALSVFQHLPNVDDLLKHGAACRRLAWLIGSGRSGNCFLGAFHAIALNEPAIDLGQRHLAEKREDGFLVPPTAVSVPLKFPREGIKYDELSDEDKEKWDLLEWEDKLPSGDIDANAVNKWLFNTDTVDKVLEHLMTHGLKVAEGGGTGT